MVDKNDPALVKWRQIFRCLIHAGLPLLETLTEMEARLAAASLHLRGLDPGDEAQVAEGMAVATFAAEYADDLMRHFDLWDGAMPPPRPGNLKEACMIVDGILADVRDKLLLGRTGAPSTGRGQTPTPAAALGRADDPKPAGLVIERETFSVRWSGKTCKLGNTKAFHLLDRLARRPGAYASVKAIIDDVWRDEETEKATVQKTVSNLRLKLNNAGMGDLLIDGSQPDHYALIPPT